MTERLLNFLLDYGVMALVPVLLASAIGIPLPGSLLLVAAGAFASGGLLTLLPCCSARSARRWRGMGSATGSGSAAAPPR
jgi:membrane protein DedA with SNARE-associated domain